MKLLKTSDELISHMKTKGIKFNIVNKKARVDRKYLFFYFKNSNSNI